MFFSLQIDRGNIGQALSGTLLKDLHMTTNGKFGSLSSTELFFIIW
jgi:hypothetical protein